MQRNLNFLILNFWIAANRRDILTTYWKIKNFKNLSLTRDTHSLIFLKLIFFTSLTCQRVQNVLNKRYLVHQNDWMDKTRYTTKIIIWAKKLCMQGESNLRLLVEGKNTGTAPRRHWIYIWKFLIHTKLIFCIKSKWAGALDIAYWAYFEPVCKNIGLFI